MWCWLIPLLGFLASLALAYRWKSKLNAAYDELNKLGSENQRLSLALERCESACVGFKKSAQEATEALGLAEMNGMVSDTAETNRDAENVTHLQTEANEQSTTHDATVVIESTAKPIVDTNSSANTQQSADMLKADAESSELRKLKDAVKETQQQQASGDAGIKTAAMLAAAGIAAATTKKTDTKKSAFLIGVVGADKANLEKAAHTSATEQQMSKQAALNLNPESDNIETNKRTSVNTEAAAVVANTAATKTSKSATTQPSKTTQETPKAVQKASTDKSSSFFDKKAARAALGKSVKYNDLTVVEGIGPKISGLFKDAGIDTWQKLSETPVADCQKILDDAGPRYRVHIPDTWPEQASLAAKGAWDALAKLQDELDGGRKS